MHAHARSSSTAARRPLTLSSLLALPRRSLAMSWLHRLLQLQRQRSQEAIPDGPQEPDASAPDAPDLTSVGAAPAAAAPARPISGLAAPYHPRLYNNTYQADANALLEQLETTAPAALPRVQAPMLPFEPSSRSPGSSESKHARSTSRDISPVRSVAEHETT